MNPLPQKSHLDLSIVIPLLNEAESLPELIRWITDVCIAEGYDYEIIMIDDGSNDESWSVIQRHHLDDQRIVGIKFRRNYGKSAALNTAFERAKGQVVITMDADLQDSPDEIPELYRMITDEGYDIVSGWKKKRHDPIGKTAPSKFFNAVVRWQSGIQLNDFNCGLKAYKRDVVKSIELYGDLHRFIPVLAKTEGFDNITEKIVEHRARKYGYSKFGIERMMHGFLDLLSISFVGKFSKRPMHFFGSFGVVFFMIGFMILLYLSIEKILGGVAGIATRPLFFFGILTIIIGTQLFVTGFLAEMVLKNNDRKHNYRIEAVIDS